MLFFAPDEQDENLDEEEADAASDEQGEEDEGDDQDDSEDADDSDEEDDSANEDDDDNKPVTRKELRELLKGNKNDRNAHRRVTQKQKGRDTRQPSENDKRLADLENFKKQTEIANKKLDFATEYGLSKKQTNYVFKLTQRPTAKFLEKPHVKAALDAIKAQEGVARNTPSGSGKRFKAPGNKKWTELKPEERQSNFADRRRSILSNKR